MINYYNLILAIANRAGVDVSLIIVLSVTYGSATVNMNIPSVDPKIDPITAAARLQGI
jgi:hypothetical protein